MICIPILSQDTGKQTWVIIELQGVLHNTEQESLNGIDLGSLQWGNPVLKIGNHLCEGTVIKLRKPLAIMRHINPNESTSGNVEYCVEFIVKEKLLFNNRPRPVIR